MSDIKREFRQAVADIMNSWGDMVKSKVIDVTPLRTGDLRRSIYLREATADKLVVTIGSNGGIAPYNVRVHEVPFFHYTTPGTGPKYIERPVYENLPLLKEWGK